MRQRHARAGRQPDGAGGWAVIINLEEKRVSVRRFSSKKPYCGHGQVVVDGQAREVECGHCGVALDPVQALAMLAADGDRLVWEARELKRLYARRLSSAAAQPALPWHEADRA
jgi:hypothetical protein